MKVIKAQLYVNKKVNATIIATALIILLFFIINLLLLIFHVRK